MEAWRVLSEQVSISSVGQAEARQLRRLIFAGAFDTELDKQGRILVPASLREYAGIGESTVVAGMNTYFEIWAKDAWQTTLADVAEEARAMAARMASLGV